MPVGDGLILTETFRRGDALMLEPLELLRLAGARDADDNFAVDNFDAGDDELPFSGDDFFGFGLSNDDGGRNGIFLTVFVDAELFSDERELRKLFRELLRSTGRLCVDVISVFLSEFVRFGSVVLRPMAAKFPDRRERDRSKLTSFRSINFCIVIDFGIDRRLDDDCDSLVSLVVLSDDVVRSIFSRLLSV